MKAVFGKVAGTPGAKAGGVNSRKKSRWCLRQFASSGSSTTDEFLAGDNGRSRYVLPARVTTSYALRDDASNTSISPSRHGHSLSIASSLSMAPSPVVVPGSDLVGDVVAPAVKFGALCGAGGFLFGGTSGIVRGAPPFLFATASALQTFALGTVFAGARYGITQAWTTPERSLTPRDLTKASALAGGFSGGIVALISRGRSNVLPGMIMFTLFGAAGQHMYNKWTVPTQLEAPKTSFWVRMSQKSWSPVRIMSNEEYAQMLQEKMLKIDVEIAVLDDKITALKEQQAQEGPIASPHGESKD